MGLAKAAALVRLGEECTALLLTLGHSYPDTMLPPDIAVAASTTAPNAMDVRTGAAIVAEAVASAGQSVEPLSTLEGTTQCPQCHQTLLLAVKMLLVRR